MIIGLSGYAGSGKDTVAKMMQYLMFKELENMNTSDSYKYRYTTHYDYESINQRLLMEQETGYFPKKFAHSLKRICGILLQVRADYFEDRVFKEKLIDSGKMTNREFLRGVAKHLRELDPDIFVNALFKSPVYGSVNWIITDVRYENEVEAIRERGGMIVRINRASIKADQHISETGLDHISFDYTIENDGNLDELLAKVGIFMETWNIKSPFYDGRKIDRGVQEGLLREDREKSEGDRSY